MPYRMRGNLDYGSVDERAIIQAKRRDLLKTIFVVASNI